MQLRTPSCSALFVPPMVAFEIQARCDVQVFELQGAMLALRNDMTRMLLALMLTVLVVTREKIALVFRLTLAVFTRSRTELLRPSAMVVAVALSVKGVMVAPHMKNEMFMLRWTGFALPVHLVPPPLYLTHLPFPLMYLGTL